MSLLNTKTPAPVSGGAQNSCCDLLETVLLIPVIAISHAVGGALYQGTPLGVPEHDPKTLRFSAWISPEISG